MDGFKDSISKKPDFYQKVDLPENHPFKVL